MSVSPRKYVFSLKRVIGNTILRIAVDMDIHGYIRVWRLCYGCIHGYLYVISVFKNEKNEKAF